MSYEFLNERAVMEHPLIFWEEGHMCEILCTFAPSPIKNYRRYENCSSYKGE